MKISNFQFSIKGFTFIDVLVGTALMLIIFLGIFGAYQLGLKVVSQSKARISATALANQRVEEIRNLPYESVGIIEGILPTPTGILEVATTTILNNVEYTIERNIEYVSDGADGMGESDECDLDYKRVEIKVSWSGQFGGEVKLVTDVAPKNKVQEIASCQAQPGGLLSVKVFDAYGGMVESPLIEVFDSVTEELITFNIPFTGETDIPLTTSTYKVVVSKTDYNIARSYGIDEVATPKNECYARPHQEVFEGELTPVSFCIDRTGTFSVDTLSPWGFDNFSDSFSNQDKISEINNLEVTDDEVKLVSPHIDGFLISISIEPESLEGWYELSFSDLEPANTDLKYQIYYYTDENWELVPDDPYLPGNSAGFDDSPVDLSGLDITTHSQLQLHGNFHRDTADDDSPILYDWQVSWITSEATSMPLATFNLRGEKIIGTDASEDPVYKYSITTNSDSSGYINIPYLEWDLYTFSTEGTSLDLVDINPSPQPINLLPTITQPVILYLQAENSLLVSVLDNNTGEPVFDASVRLYKVGYNTTQYTNDKGQTYFIPLEVETYNLEVRALNYSDFDTTVNISGDHTQIFLLEQTD